MFPLLSSLSIPANVGRVFLMLHKQRGGFREAGEDKGIKDDPGRKPVGWGQDGCRLEESGGLSSRSDRSLSSSDTCSPGVQRQLFLSAEAPNATPGVCVCVHQFLYGFPLRYEMNLKIVIIISQTAIMPPFSMD